MTRAVVFAYHNVGVRCLRVLLAHRVEVPLVVTHADDPGEPAEHGVGRELEPERAARRDGVDRGGQDRDQRGEHQGDARVEQDGHQHADGRHRQGVR